jgi:hypothetical protein
LDDNKSTLVKKNTFKYKMMTWMASLMMACDKATFLISKAREEKLSLKEKINLRIHLLSCKLCLRYEKEIIALNRYLKGTEFHTCDHHHLDAEQRSRIHEALVKEME